MNKQELEKKLENLERDEFFLAMKDRWTKEDFEHDREIAKQIREIKKELNKC